MNNYGKRKSDNQDYMNNDDGMTNQNKRYDNAYSNNSNNNANLNYINPNTLINVDQSKPVGIDFNAFIGQMDETVHSISQSNDLPIIQEVSLIILFPPAKVMEQHQSFKGILVKRMNCLRMLATSWSKGDRDGTLTALTIMKDLAVSNDFFNYAFLKSDQNNIHLKYDHSLMIFPQVLSLISSKYDMYYKNGIKIAWTILKLYYDTIIQAKNTPVFGGVDLNREEKMKKFDAIIEFFEKIRVLDVIERNLKKDKTDDSLNLQQFIAELDYFVKNCRKSALDK